MVNQQEFSGSYSDESRLIAILSADVMGYFRLMGGSIWKKSVDKNLVYCGVFNVYLEGGKRIRFQ